MPTPLSRFTVAVAVLAIAAPPSRAAAQQTPRGASPQVLTLDDAVRIAERESQSVRIARAGSDRAAGQQLQARSQLFPQIAGSLSYQRSLQGVGFINIKIIQTSAFGLTYAHDFY